MSKTEYPTATDLGAFLYSAGLISAPVTSEQGQMDLAQSCASAKTQWERRTGYVPFLSGSSTVRQFDPPGPERGPIGIYVGVANVGGGRKLFLNAGIRTVTQLKIGRTYTTPTLSGTISGTVTAGAFTGTLTADLGTGTFTGTGTGTITDGVTSTTLTFSISGTGNSTFSITGTTTSSPVGTCTGNVTMTGASFSPGVALTENVDFWMRPINADLYDRPFTFVEFAFPQWGNPRSITIEGAFGFGTTVPDDAWLAILKSATLELIPSLEIALTRGQSQIKLGNDTFTFNPKVFDAQSSKWAEQIDKVICRYKRKMLA